MEKIKEYAFSTVLDASYEDAIFKVTDALKEEGFGVLTEIDVKSTLKKKLDGIVYETDEKKLMFLLSTPCPLWKSLRAKS